MKGSMQAVHDKVEYCFADHNSFFVCHFYRFGTKMVFLALHTVHVAHGLINYIDTNAMSSSTKIDLLRDFAVVFNQSEFPSPPMTPYLPLTHCIRVYFIVYTYSHREGGREGGELTIEKVRGATVHKAGSKIPT
jgi:hypothetical protein